MVFTAHINATGATVSRYRGANAGESGVPGTIDSDVDDKGNTTIYVNVVDAPQDGSLIADVNEPKQQPLQMGISADGEVITITPNREPTIAELSLMRLLARNFVAGHDDTPGSSWTLAYGPDKVGQLHVTVQKTDDAHVVLGIKGRAFATNPVTRRQQLDGTVTYDPAHTIPVSADVTESVQIQNGSTTTTTQYSAQFSLQADSMGGS